MLLPIIAGRCEAVVDMLPRRDQWLLEQDPHVAELVGRRYRPAEMAGERDEQFLGAVSGAHNMHDDGGQRHLHAH